MAAGVQVSEKLAKKFATENDKNPANVRDLNPRMDEVYAKELATLPLKTVA